MHVLCGIRMRTFIFMLLALCAQATSLQARGLCPGFFETILNHVQLSSSLVTGETETLSTELQRSNAISETHVVEHLEVQQAQDDLESFMGTINVLKDKSAVIPRIINQENQGWDFLIPKDERIKNEIRWMVQRMKEAVAKLSQKEAQSLLSPEMIKILKEFLQDTNQLIVKINQTEKIAFSDQLMLSVRATALFSVQLGTLKMLQQKDFISLEKIQKNLMNYFEELSSSIISDRTRDYLFQLHLTRENKRPPFLPIITIRTLGVDEINEALSNGLVFIQVSDQMVLADGSEFEPDRMFAHDVFHGLSFTELTKEQLEAFRSFYLKFKEFTKQKNSFEQRFLKVLWFYMTHEQEFYSPENIERSLLSVKSGLFELNREFSGMEVVLDLLKDKTSGLGNNFTDEDFDHFDERLQKGLDLFLYFLSGMKK